MATQLTRRQMRERIRRGRLGILTPVEQAITGALDGDAPTQQPDPTNEQLNDAIEDAVAHINIEAQLYGSNTILSKAVTAQTANGPYMFQLSDSALTGTAFQINDVRSLGWAVTGSDEIPLKPYRFEDLDISWERWRSEPPGTPRYYIIESYAVYLFPAPSAAGTVYFRAGESMLAPSSDTETVLQLSADFNHVILDVAALLIAEIMAGDVEMQQRVPLLKSRAIQGIGQVKRWKREMNRRYQGRITHRSHRTTTTVRRR